MAAPSIRGLQVLAVEQDTADSVLVTLDAEGDPDFTFGHGQHLTFRREFDGVDIRRSYSICTAAPDGPLQVAVRLVPGGVFSTWVNQELEPGMTVEVMAPTGHFTHELDPSSARHYALVCAGSGVTPIASIAATVLDQEPESSVTLVQVNRTSTSVMLLDHIEALRNRHLGRLQIFNVFTQEPGSSALLSGRPDSERLRAFVAAGVLPSSPDAVFACGPEMLVRDLRAVYEEAGLDPDRFHDELFTSAQTGRALHAAPQIVADTDEPVAAGRALMFGRETSFDVYPGDSVLDAIQRVRPDVPFSCRAGVCSTCRAALLDGEVEMELTHGLVPGEEEAGIILTCQAMPVTSTVHVDFDC